MVLEAGVDLADFVHPSHRDHHLAMVRGLAADQPGIATLRHQRDPVRAGELADRRDFRRRARPQHEGRASVKQVALLGDIGRDVGRVGHRVFVTDDMAQNCAISSGEQRRRGGWLDDIHLDLSCVHLVSCWTRKANSDLILRSALLRASSRSFETQRSRSSG